MKILRLLLPLATLAGSSHAAIIYSGIQNILIPTTFVGVYIDIDGGGTVAEEAAGWDINPIFGGEAIANSPSFHPVAATIALDAPILNLSFGQPVNGSSLFPSTYPGGFSSSQMHVGNGSGQFVSSSEGYIGFSFTPNLSSVLLYGWIRVDLSNTSATGLVKDWAYEDSGVAIPAGAVPEPASAALSTVLAACLAFRRRRD